MTIPPVDEAALRDVRLLLMDVDGVLTDGLLWVGADGATFKAFFVRDGHGIKLLHQAGVETGVISGRRDRYVRERAQELGMSVVVLGVIEKDKAVAAAMAERRLEKRHVAFIGDDSIDASAMALVGAPIAVADAHPDLLPHVRYVTRAAGGRGAVREVADLILRARGAEPPESRA